MPNTAEFQIERLENAGVKHVFCVPGDFCLGLCKRLSESKIKLVVCADEASAGFAADAYARVHGIGCVLTTYNVGTLKLCNAIAGAYAERSPVIVLSGSPGMTERHDDFKLHHMVRDFDMQQKVFEQLTCASVVLDDPVRAAYKIDEAMEKMYWHRQPVYIEIPRDIAEMRVKYDVYQQGTPHAPLSNPDAMAEALQEAFEMIRTSSRPVLLAGVQIQRFGLGKQLIRFAEKNGLPIATTPLGKSVVDERHKNFIGVYAGACTETVVKDYVDNSDCVIILGEMLTDITLGFKKPQFKSEKTVFVTAEGLNISNHNYRGVGFTEFCTELFKNTTLKHELPTLSIAEKPEYKAETGVKITVQRFFDKVETILSENTVVCADIGESFFGALNMNTNGGSFICPAQYTSMGFAIPAALGVGLAKPNIRPIVLVGDGAFQMSSQELGVIVKQGLNPIVFVLNNAGYGTERLIMDGSFNDIPAWEYHKIVDVMGGTGFKVTTEDELESAVQVALQSKKLVVINVVVDPKDMSCSLKRATEGFKGSRVAAENVGASNLNGRK
jgi:indolepyruvate decarboxylase